jgi:uncharacterized repeat protein (TIGR02543 family)
MGTTKVTITATYTINQYAFDYVDYDGTVLQTTDYEYGADLSGVTAPSDPARVGYTFYRWGGTVPETMGATKITITALYSINKYTIRYNLDGGSNNVGNVKTYNINSKTITLLPAKKASATFLGWYDNSSFRGFAVTRIPTGSYGNITLYAKWDMVQYTVEYVDYDGTGLQITAYDTGADLSGVTAPADPVRDGYTFDSWSGTVPATMGTTKVIITATYTLNQYTISYNLDGGSNNIDNISAYNIEDNTFTLLEATKDEETFIGWYDTPDFSGLLVTEIPIGSYRDLTLYAKWEINEYIVFNIRVDSSYDPVNQIILSEGEIITSVSLAAYHSLAITSDSRIFTWGRNDFGQLGDGTTTNKLEPIEITNRFNLVAGETITSVSLGSNFSSLITSYGRVFTWGSNEFGQLGNGTETSRFTPTEITAQFNLAVGETIYSMSLSREQSSAVTSNGRILVWGYNVFGQLGDGTYVNKNMPTETTNIFNLAIGETITNVSLSGFHGLATTSENRVFTWGNNEGGALGDGTTEDTNTPIDITNQFNLVVGETITNITLGLFHSSVVTSRGRIFTWGDNRDGQLGDGTTIDEHVPIEITYQFNLIAGETITSTSFEAHTSSVLTSEGRLFTWGGNDYGTLGDGTTIDNYVPTEITNQFNLAIGETITVISLAFTHSSVVTSEGRLFTWGYNAQGQLGDNTIVSKYIPMDITYNFMHFSAYEEVTYGYDTELTDDFISYVGYTFDGWYTDSSLSQPYTGTLMPNYPLYALYIQD